jgi:Rieske Fe-S protein
MSDNTSDISLDRRAVLQAVALASITGTVSLALAQTTPPKTEEVLKLASLNKFINDVWGSWVFSFDGRDALLVRVPQADKRTLSVKFKNTKGEEITAYLVAHQLVCTHLGCSSPAIDIDDEETAKKRSERRIFCQCHGSEFRQIDGSVLKGPAKDPLRSIKLDLTADTLIAVGFF